jgi:hypothetical protein
MSAPRTGTPFVLTSLAIAVMFCAAAVGCTRHAAPASGVEAGGPAAP